MIHHEVVTLARADRFEADAIREVKETLLARCQDWAETYGYWLVEIQVREYETLGDGSVKLEARADGIARWDGRWGEVRAALAEDGLLPESDLRDRDVAGGGSVGRPSALPHQMDRRERAAQRRRRWLDGWSSTE